jgi:predicted secreted protein
MAAINGTALLLYSEGVAIAMQRGISVSVDQDLPDATNKESAGWAQHINGMLSAKIDFDALFSSPSSPDMNANGLMNYLLSRESLYVAIMGLSFPIIGKADLSSLSFVAPQEGAMTLSGSLKIDGRLYCLTSATPSLLTDPDSGGTDYETHTQSGTGFSSLINSAGSAYCKSNTFSVTDTYVYTVITFLTKNSGELPSVTLYEVGGGAGAISNTVAMTEGLNFIKLTATSTKSGCLNITNTGASNLAMTDIYIVI